MAPFEDDELRVAIMQMKSGKAPGSDGLPIGFYKTYLEQLLPVLKEVYMEAQELQILPGLMREALISYLLKPSKLADLCDSYRPLSLINTDTEILAKLLANRLSLLMEKLVLPDQAGFIPGRATSHNLCTLFSILQNADPQLALVVVFLDTTKAFDSFCGMGLPIYYTSMHGAP